MHCATAGAQAISAASSAKLPAGCNVQMEATLAAAHCANVLRTWTLPWHTDNPAFHACRMQPAHGVREVLQSLLHLLLRCWSH